MVGFWTARPLLRFQAPLLARLGVRLHPLLSTPEARYLKIGISPTADLSEIAGYGELWWVGHKVLPQSKSPGPVQHREGGSPGSPVEAVAPPGTRVTLAITRQVGAGKAIGRGNRTPSKGQRFVGGVPPWIYRNRASVGNP